MGPRMLPCGTPETTGKVSERLLLIDTFCTCNAVEISYKQQHSVATYNANSVFLTWSYNLDTSVHLKLRKSCEHSPGIVRANSSKIEGSATKRNLPQDL